jgi:hypothetical protein
MNDGISFINNEDIEKKVKIILGQTDYTNDVAEDLLKKNNYDEIAVIRGYFGLAEKKALPTAVSLNQEIYKQIRHKLDGSMKEYNDRKNANEN